MKKIMFNDKYGLTQAVLDGRKTQTRRIATIQPPYKNSEICFPTDVLLEDEPEKHPLWLAYCWRNKDNPEEFTSWIKPKYKENEFIAVAQSYEDCGNLPDFELDEDGYPIMPKRSGCFNKMFVRADLMPYKIRITKVRIQRLQNISDEDCMAEGIWKAENIGLEGTTYWYSGLVNSKYRTPQEAYAALIDHISGKGTWESNPYVWVYEFELVK